MRKPNYLDWETVFLDTSIIFAYFHALRKPDKVPLFVKKVIDNLAQNKTQSGKERRFFISAVTLSEILSNSTDVSRTQAILNTIRVPSMTFVSFDEDVASFMTANYHRMLGKKANKYARDWGFAEGDLLMAREWISKDLMIIATAHQLECDVILTLDKKTLLPAATEVGCFCAVAIEENFNTAGKNIFEYKGQ